MKLQFVFNALSSMGTLTNLRKIEVKYYKGRVEMNENVNKLRPKTKFYMHTIKPYTYKACLH